MGMIGEGDPPGQSLELSWVPNALLGMALREKPDALLLQMERQVDLINFHFSLSQSLKYISVSKQAELCFKEFSFFLLKCSHGGSQKPPFPDQLGWQCCDFESASLHNNTNVQTGGEECQAMAVHTTSPQR